jgi:hypothetical protein
MFMTAARTAKDILDGQEMEDNNVEMNEETVVDRGEKSMQNDYLQETRSIRYSKGFIDILKHLTHHRNASTSPIYRSTPPQGSGSAGDGYTSGGGSYYGPLSKIELRPGRGGYGWNVINYDAVHRLRVKIVCP